MALLSFLRRGGNIGLIMALAVGFQSWVVSRLAVPRYLE